MCPRYTIWSARPRQASLRSAPRTQLQSAQELPELEASALPLSLGARVRYVASALLVYSYWYSLGHGVLPPDMLEDE